MEKLQKLVNERIEKNKDTIKREKQILDDMDTEIMNLYIDVCMAEDTDQMCRLENELNSMKCQYRQKKAEFTEKERRINKEIMKLEFLRDER